MINVRLTLRLKKRLLSSFSNHFSDIFDSFFQRGFVSRAQNKTERGRLAVVRIAANVNVLEAILDVFEGEGDISFTLIASHSERQNGIAARQSVFNA